MRRKDTVVKHVRYVMAIPLTLALVATVLLAPSARPAQAQRPALSGTLTFFDYGIGPSPQIMALVRAYERVQPGVHVKVTQLPPGNDLSYIDAQLSGGTASDIMTLATDEQPWKDLNKGWWLDLTRYAQAPDPYVP